MSYIAYGDSRLNIGEDFSHIYVEEELNIVNLEKYLFTYFPKHLPEYETKDVATVVHHGTHWAFLLIDRGKREIAYFDSKRNWNKVQTRYALERITSRLSAQTPEKLPFTLVYKINKVIQQDSYECGVWCLFFFAKFLEDPTFDFNTLNNRAGQRLIQQYRAHVSYILHYLHCANTLVDREQKRLYKEAYQDEEDALAKFEAKRPLLLREEWNRVLANCPIRPDTIQ
jgi:hypothetical protein